MTEELENTLRIEQLKQQGKILSGFTHELKNHLAVINESNGLLDDYLAMGKVADRDLAAKIQTICTRIHKRVQTSARMSQSLNSFAHRTDTPTSTFGINNFIQEQLVFLERFAILQEVEVISDNSVSTISLHTDPCLLQFLFTKLFFTCLNCVKSQTKTVIQIVTEEIPHGAQILFKLNGEFEQDMLPTKHSFTGIDEQLALKKIAGEIGYDKEEGGDFKIILKVLNRD